MTDHTDLIVPPEQLPATPHHSAGGAAVLLKGEIEIYPDQRLQHLDKGPVKAFAATGRAKEKSFALVCEKSLVPKINLASKYLTITSQFLPRLIGAGIVDWSPSKQQRYVFVYENKLGLPLANPGNAMAMGYKADQLLHGFVKKVVPLLRSMRDMDFVFGGFRTTNIFSGGGQGFEKIMFGDNLAIPSDFTDLGVYETIERSAAQPLGRGLPNFSDDLYTFGVMLGLMLRTSDPLEGQTNEEILKYKIEHGSYQAVLGKERITGGMLELLRGLLQDDFQQRWTIEDINVWMDGQRVTHKQAGPLKIKAARPLDFYGEKYLRPQILALDLHRNPVEIVKLSDNGELKLWINRSIQEKALEDNAEEAVQAARETGTIGESYPQRVASCLAAALGPGLPILYRHLKFMPDAFGRMLAEGFAVNRDLNFFAEILQSPIASFWSSMNQMIGADMLETVSKFDTCRAYLRQSTLGYGLERCLYHLCPEAPCMSEKLKDYYVRTPEELVLAYEAMASGGTKPEGFFDRHIIAFLSVKDRSVIDPYIPDLNAAEPFRNILGALRIFSSIQKRGKMQPVPGITAWLADKTDPLIARYHNREERVRLKAQISKIREKGDISKIEQVFDVPGALHADQAGFHHAAHAYVAFKNEYSKLEYDLANDKKFGYSSGRHAAAAVSGVIATIAVLLYLFFKMTTRSAFTG